LRRFVALRDNSQGSNVRSSGELEDDPAIDRAEEAYDESDGKPFVSVCAISRIRTLVAFSRSRC
jgi:hypothetical protein